MAYARQDDLLCLLQTLGVTDESVFRADFGECVLNAAQVAGAVIEDGDHRTFPRQLWGGLPGPRGSPWTRFRPGTGRPAKAPAADRGVRPTFARAGFKALLIEVLSSTATGRANAGLSSTRISTRAQST